MRSTFLFLLMMNSLLAMPIVAFADSTSSQGLDLTGLLEFDDDDILTTPAIKKNEPPKAVEAKKEDSSVKAASSNLVTPARYLDFSSPSPASASKIQGLVSKYGKNILIGADPGDSFMSGQFANTMRAAKAAGVKVHIYLEGPGGVTGSSGIQPDELARMRRGAAGAGININSGNWRQEWNRHGWLTHTRKQLGELQRLYGPGFSYEIDNLYNAKKTGGPALVSLFKEQEKWQKENGIKATLMLKNLEPSELNYVADAVNRGEISRSFFSDFHISESGTGNRSQQESAAARMGIQSVASNNTYAYDARGEFKADAYFRKNQPASARIALRQ